MPISTNMIVRIAHADIMANMAFPRSVAHWQHHDDRERPWKVLAGDSDAILIGKNDGVVIDGNCTNGVSLPDGGVVHIYGNLDSKLDVAGHIEVVVTGDVLPEATIDASGICHVFVGGEFSGELRSSGSATIWIECNFSGTVRTGDPATHIYVGGDYNGRIMPTETASLLWLTVGGFASQASMSRIAECAYTVFNASIAQCDVSPGLYPTNGRARKASGGRSFNRWCVRTENGR